MVTAHGPNQFSTCVKMTNLVQGQSDEGVLLAKHMAEKKQGATVDGRDANL